jgi:hypothetical protein
VVGRLEADDLSELAKRGILIKAAGRGRWKQKEV